MQYTFRDSDRTIEITRVPVGMLGQLGDEFPAPALPKTETDYGDGKKVWEDNPNDPDYRAALADWRKKINNESQKLIAQRALPPLSDAQKEEVKEVRTYWQENFGHDLALTDKEIFVYKICAATAEDIQEFVEFVTRRSQPTQGGIADANKHFRPVNGVPVGDGPDLQGAGHLQHQPAP